MFWKAIHFGKQTLTFLYFTSAPVIYSIYYFFSMMVKEKISTVTKPDKNASEWKKKIYDNPVRLQAMRQRCLIVQTATKLT